MKNRKRLHCRPVLLCKGTRCEARVGLVAALLAACGLAVATGACRRAEGPDEAGAKVRTFVSIPPLAYFVERIGGDRVSAGVLVEPGRDPHTFSPTPRQITDLAEADAYFHLDMPFEETIARKLSRAAGRTRLVDLTDRLDPDVVLGGSAEEHLHPPQAGRAHPAHDDETEHAQHAHHHDHGEVDPHVWLSPPLAARMAERICTTLSELDPAGEATYHANLEALQAELDELHAELAAVLEPVRGRTFYVFHPAFGWFARTYGLRQEAVQTGGKSPGPRHLRHLIEQAQAEGVRVIFVQPQFAGSAARTLADGIGGAVVPIDPLARDYIENLRRVAAEIRSALRERS